MFKDEGRIMMARTEKGMRGAAARAGGRLPAVAAVVLLSLLLVLAFAFSLSWIWTALALVMKTPESVMMVSSMATFPLTFASNIFVDPATMPDWLQTFVNLNPITHVVTAVRGLMHGAVMFDAIGASLLGCAALIAIFAPLTMYLYRNKGAR